METLEPPVFAFNFVESGGEQNLFPKGHLVLGAAAARS